MSESENPAGSRDAEAARLRRARNKYKAELEAAQTQLATLTTELEQLKSAPDANAKEVERLRGELRTRDHRSAWEKAASGKINPAAIDAAWKLSGWAADTDEVDTEKLTQNIQDLLSANQFLAVPEPTDNGSLPPGESIRQSGLPTPLSGFGRGPAPQNETKDAGKAVYRLT